MQGRSGWSRVLAHMSLTSTKRYIIVVSCGAFVCIGSVKCQFNNSGHSCNCKFICVDVCTHMCNLYICMDVPIYALCLIVFVFMQYLCLWYFKFRSISSVFCLASSSTVSVCLGKLYQQKLPYIIHMSIFTSSTHYNLSACIQEVRIVDAIVLTLQTGLHVEALETHVDQLGCTRTIGTYISSL